MEHSQILEKAVLTGTPQDVAEACKKLEDSENSCRALALACRFRGLEYVNALVENGATFKYVRPDGQGGYYTVYYWVAPLEISTGFCRGAYFINSDPCFLKEILLKTNEGETAYKVLPIKERAEIVKYLCENSERVQLNIGELLFYSIMSGSKEITAVLKEMGAVFSERRAAHLTEGGQGFEWQEFCYMSEYLGEDEYIEIMRDIIKEVGGKTLRFTDSIYWANYNPYNNNFRLFKPDFFRFILENFNQKKMNKTQFMKGAIDNNSVQCLEICAENGWLKMPRKRDEIIKYAADNEKTECTAWLLDFKNRTADLAAEREKAEKKMMRELNADPNSVTELRKIWGFESREDGSIIITKYKGSRTEIEVPAKIGKNAVTAIGDFAFSPDASRLTREQRDLRRTISKVKLPESIQFIGENAFCDCWGMSELNIPDSVTEIGEGAFGNCRKVTEFTVPETVEKMGGSMFCGCTALRRVKLPESTSEIGDYMFSNCSVLEEIKLPAAVSRIGKFAFSWCASLKEIVVPNGVLEIEQQAFKSCNLLEKVVIPPSVKKMKNYIYRKEDKRTVFFNSENVVVIVEPKSYAERYCKNNGIKCSLKEGK